MGKKKTVFDPESAFKSLISSPPVTVDDDTEKIELSSEISNKSPTTVDSTLTLTDPPATHEAHTGNSERIVRSFQIDRDLNRALKRASADNGKKLYEIVNECLREGPQGLSIKTEDF